MKLVLMLLGLCAATAGWCDEATLCYNYECQLKTVVDFALGDLAWVHRLLEDARSPEEEREAIAYAMGWMYFLAGQQSPVWRDRGGNLNDDETQDGRMDCIDHSTNTGTWLALLARRGWLRYHRVGAPIRRGHLLSVHWSARIVATQSGEEYAVDTWFLDPGLPATIYPLQEWLDGARPPGTEILRWH